MQLSKWSGSALGRLWGWGQRSGMRLGGSPTQTNQYNPIQIGEHEDWVHVSAGNEHSFGIREDDLGRRTLWAWGQRQHGRLGLGALSAGAGSEVITRVGTGTNWLYVSAGHEHSAGIRGTGTSGHLYTWGNGLNGGLGINPVPSSNNAPVRIATNISDWTRVSAGNGFALALRANGQLFSWGNNGSARTGQNSVTGNTPVPTQVGTASNWRYISAGSLHSLAINANGELWSWGSNSQSRTGHDTTSSNTTEPRRVGTASGWESVSAGTNHSIAIRAGSLYGMRSNSNGRLGDGTTTQRLVPTAVVFAED